MEHFRQEDIDELFTDMLTGVHLSIWLILYKIPLVFTYSLKELSNLFSH